MSTSENQISRRTVLKGLAAIPVITVVGYQGGTAASGGCPIFPGKEVAAAGWCKSSVAKV